MGSRYSADPAGPYAQGADGDGDGDVGVGGGVAGDVAGGVDVDVADDGDVHGHLRRWGVHAGVAGGADGRCRRRVQRGWCVPPTIDVVAGRRGSSTASIRPSGDGTADMPVTVTATVADGFGWGQLPAVGARSMPTTATLSVVLEGTSCDAVTPVAPTVTQAVCVDGVLQPPSLTLPVTTGSRTAADPASGWVPGGHGDGDGDVGGARGGVAGDLADWAPDPASPTTVATFTVTFDPVACKPVPPVAPTVNQATCTAGAVRPPRRHSRSLLRR